MWRKVSDGATPGYDCFQSTITVKKKLKKALRQYRLATKAGEKSIWKSTNSTQRDF